MSLPADLRRGSRGCCFWFGSRFVAVGLGTLDESPGRLASGVSRDHPTHNTPDTTRPSRNPRRQSVGRLIQTTPPTTHRIRHGPAETRDASRLGDSYKPPHPQHTRYDTAQQKPATPVGWETHTNHPTHNTPDTTRPSRNPRRESVGRLIQTTPPTTHRIRHGPAETRDASRLGDSYKPPHPQHTRYDTAQQKPATRVGWETHTNHPTHNTPDTTRPSRNPRRESVGRLIQTTPPTTHRIRHGPAETPDASRLGDSYKPPNDQTARTRERDSLLQRPKCV